MSRPTIPPNSPKIQSWHILGETSLGKYYNKKEVKNIIGTHLLTDLPFEKQDHLNSVKKTRYFDKTSARKRMGYRLTTAHGSVNSAEIMADYLRKRGFNARVVKWNGGMAAGVYIRPSAKNQYSGTGGMAIREELKRINYGRKISFDNEKIPNLLPEKVNRNWGIKVIPVYNRTLEDRRENLESRFRLGMGSEDALEFGDLRPLNADEENELKSLIESIGFDWRKKKLLIIKDTSGEDVSYGFVTALEAAEILYNLGVYPMAGDMVDFLRGSDTINEALPLRATQKKRLNQLLLRRTRTDNSSIMWDTESLTNLRESVGKSTDIDFKIFNEDVTLEDVYEDLPDTITSIDSLPFKDEGFLTVNENAVFEQQGYIDPEIIMWMLQKDYPDLVREEIEELYMDLDPGDLYTLLEYNTQNVDDSERVIMQRIEGDRDGSELGVWNENVDIENPQFKVPRNMDSKQRAAYSKLVWGL